MKIVSTFIHNDVTFGLDSDGKYWILTPVLPLPVPSEANEETTPEAKISVLLKNFEIPQHILGFDYLVTSVCLVAKDPKYRQIVDVLNPEVAKIHNTTSNRVERAVRTAINHCNTNGLYFALFGTKELVTSKRFIITLSKQLTT